MLVNDDSLAVDSHTYLNSRERLQFKSYYEGNKVNRSYYLNADKRWKNNLLT